MSQSDGEKFIDGVGRSGFDLEAETFEARGSEGLEWDLGGSGEKLSPIFRKNKTGRVGWRLARRGGSGGFLVLLFGADVIDQALVIGRVVGQAGGGICAAGDVGDGGDKGSRKNVGFRRAAQLANLDDFLDGEKIFLRSAQEAEVEAARTLNFDVALAISALGVKEDGINIEAARQGDRLASEGRDGFLSEMSGVHQV